ncbi:MAG TPA: hypothetical protein VK895_04955 [Jiangellaceae bacterium]|nr:hypothetical protein [Jiangellaceae bacterium]
MSVTRRNILESKDARDRYLEGVVELSRPDPQITALDVYEQLREFMPRADASHHRRRSLGDQRPELRRPTMGHRLEQLPQHGGGLAEAATDSRRPGPSRAATPQSRAHVGWWRNVARHVSE